VKENWFPYDKYVTGGGADKDISQKKQWAGKGKETRNKPIGAP